MSSPNNIGQTYRYDGPVRLHALVGQVLAGLGYIGGKGELPVGAVVTIRETEGKLILSCTFRQGEESFSSEAWFFDHTKEAGTLKTCLMEWHQRYTGAPPSPWGTLMGVRPTKLVHRLFDGGYTPEAAQAHLVETYHTSRQTAADLVHMAALQRPYVSGGTKSVSVYVGIPYCSSHCLYCSFPSRLIGAEGDEALQAFVAAMKRDIAAIHAFCAHYDLSISTVYVGGGTPTCLTVWALERLLKAMRENFGITQEWTVEAGRPDTATREKLQLLYDYGVDRISVNPQTMQQRLLDALGRKHRVEDIYAMYNTCKQIGFRLVNMDFIAGLPGQSVEDMQENMEIVCQLHPENVTIHTLALKKRAPLFHHPLRQHIPPAPLVQDMVTLCQDRLGQGGYIPYYMYRQTYMAASFANVGYALPEAIGRYNIEMMEERQSVLGAGPGSATKLIAQDGQGLQKLYMPKTIADYVQHVDEKIMRRQHLGAIISGGEDW